MSDPKASTELTPAAFATSKADGNVLCGLCPHRCHIAPGDTGTCRTRRNVDGTLMATTYGHLFAATDDPIEKKPLFHYRPGTRTFSIASLGCNLVCPFCQNHELSRGLERQLPTNGSHFTPDELVAATRMHRSRSISFTYSEPTLSFEFARDTASAATPHGIELIYVTNGQIAEAPVRELATFIHAANVDLKSFSKTNYRKVLGGSLSATLRTIEILSRAGVWVEVTTLVIPGFNDDDDELKQMADFIVDINADIPWHISRFHGANEWRNRAATPADTLRHARELGLAHGLKYVYTGNLPGDDGGNTFCPRCNEVVIERYGFRIAKMYLENGCCAGCGEPITGVGLP